MRQKRAEVKDCLEKEKHDKAKDRWKAQEAKKKWVNAIKVLLGLD